MALIKINFFSKILQQYTKVNIVLPDDFHDARVLWLLGGFNGDESVWMRHTNIEDLANLYHFIAIMPDGRNSFYIDSSVDQYETFFFKELMPKLQDMFSFSKKANNNYLAGNSMGGFGALYYAFKYPKTFGKVATLSAVTDLTSFRQNPHFPVCPEYYEALFPNRNYTNDAYNLKKLQQKNHPQLPIYMTVGKDDFLYRDNQKMATALQATYVETAGEHNWFTWTKAILSAVKWLFD